MSNYRVIGKPKPIQDAALKVCGRKTYVGDMSLPGMLFGRLVLSPRPHARIASIDVSAARALPGVRAVATWADDPGRPYNSAKRMIDAQVIENERVLDRTVRFAGDKVCAIAADTDEIAAAACKLVKVEYEDLPAVLTIDDALSGAGAPIHPGGNALRALEAGDKDIDAVLAACPHVFEGTYTTPPIHQGPIETHCCIADWGADGKLTVIAPSQNTFAYRVILSDLFGLPQSKVRVVSPAIGGGFGGKLECTIEPVCALLSRMAGRPVKMVLDRRDDVVSTRCRHGSRTRVRLGYDDAGNILAIDCEAVTNTGAYAGSVYNVAGALMENPFMLYVSPHVHVRVTPVYTNTLPAGAMRGYGGPEIYFAFQRAAAEVARALGMDFADLERKNLLSRDHLPPTGHGPAGNPRPGDCLERCLELIGYDGARAEQEASAREGGRYAVGVGLAVGSHGNNCFGVHRDNSSPMIKMDEDGSCVLYTGSHEMGNDSVGMQMEVISELCGVPMDRIVAVAADTETVLWHIGDYASRGVFVTVAAVRLAAQKMADELRREAAGLLEVPAARVQLGAGEAWDGADPSKRATLREVMTYCQAVSHRELVVHVTYEAPRGAISYGAHAAVVRVDRQTGRVEVLRYAAVHDVGFVLNPLMIEGQLEGGIAMGLGYALSEQLSVDEKGRQRERSLKACGLPRADEMPRELLCDFVTGDGGEPDGPFGAKALGESPVVPVAPAVVNAVVNALGGVQINDLPARPERVLAAIRADEEEESL